MDTLRILHKINRERSELTLSREDALKVTRPLTEIAEEEEEDKPCGPRYRRDYLITKKKYQHSSSSTAGPGAYAGNEILTSDESNDYYKSLAPQMYDRIMTRRNNSNIKPEKISSEKKSRGRSRTESLKEDIEKVQTLGGNGDVWPNEGNGSREEDDEEIIFDFEL